MAERIDGRKLADEVIATVKTGVSDLASSGVSRASP